MNIEINEQEVLRYLGHRGQGIGEDIKRLIKECREEVKKEIAPKYIYELFNIKVKDIGVVVEGTNMILKGEAIKKHLSKSNKVALLVVTLGNNIERLTRLYEKSNLTKGLIIDACATTAVEEVCDYAEGLVKDIANKEDKKINFRFSPGYGDLPLDIQREFITVMNANRRIGVMVSDHDLLFPRKSVTAIIGFVNKEEKTKKKSCNECSHYKQCRFRREGTSCGI